MFEHLTWDTDFFGFKVAKLKDDITTEHLLLNTLKTLKKEAYKLCYWFIPPDDKTLNTIAQKRGGVHVDEKVTYSLALDPVQSPVRHDDISEYKKETATHDLIQLSIEAGIYSRFRLDKHIPENKFRELYSQWMQNSVNGRFAEKVFVYRGKERIEGMITLSVKNNRGVIGLIGVSEKVRGKGIGRKLVQVSIDFFIQKNVKVLDVITQKANKPACMFYEKCGFQVSCLVNVYHFWLKSASKL